MQTNESIFTVMCYNVLCDKYATRQMYGYCPSWALEWEYRKKGILEEIRHYSADIISLQEVETDQFYNFFLPELKREGYDGIFSPKSRAKTMAENDRKYVDGCAIFYRTAKVRLGAIDHGNGPSLITRSNKTKKYHKLDSSILAFKIKLSLPVHGDINAIVYNTHSDIRHQVIKYTMVKLNVSARRCLRLCRNILGNLVCIFTLIKEHLVEFNQLAMANAEGSDNMLNRVMPRDNIGLAALLRTTEAAWDNGNIIRSILRQSF
ncbi:hypothetical protein KQX54_007687 [Cotesia glomerata]|uniref:Endonuclease/exonuclease/phosphatase domain-containing protein n=1 Tax=Cotesia glomerata TaxID=32391 RepID=A0AAV7IZ62_COTGL|nr:hypothetical protein KQX54_007687 [Cotesia glomerata]